MNPIEADIQTVEVAVEIRDYSRQIGEIAVKINKAKEQKKVAKEMLEQHLRSSAEYQDLLAAADEARLKKKVVKSKLTTEGFGRTALEGYEEKRNDLKELEEQMSHALEAQFIATGKLNIQANPYGELIEVKRSFKIPAKQLSLF